MQKKGVFFKKNYPQKLLRYNPIFIVSKSSRSEGLKCVDGWMSENFPNAFSMGSTLKKGRICSEQILPFKSRPIEEACKNNFYQSPVILTELFQHNLINASYLTACYLYQVMMTLHFLNDVANDAELTQTSKIMS